MTAFHSILQLEEHSNPSKTDSQGRLQTQLERSRDAYYKTPDCPTCTFNGSLIFPSFFSPCVRHERVKFTMASAEHHMQDVELLKNPLSSRGRSNGHIQPAALDMIPHCVSDGSMIARNQSAKRPKKRKNHRTDSLIGAVCQWTVEHQVGMSGPNQVGKPHMLTPKSGLSVNLLLLHAMAHICFPRIRQTTRKFYQLSYYNPDTGKCAAGWDDLYMVLYSIVALTGLRAFMLDYVLAPMAGMVGIRKRKDKVRFAEQGWVLIYYTAFWSLGMVGRICHLAIQKAHD